MKKITIFGKPGSGKSVLSKKLAAATGIPLHALDLIEYTKNGDKVKREDFDQGHDKILSQDHWIIDGFGPIDTFYKRLHAADTLIYIDLPYIISYWLVTKRLLISVLSKPEGWPEGSSVLKGTLQSYKTLKICPRFWNSHFMEELEAIADGKTLYVIRSVAELNGFVERYFNPKQP